MQVNDRFLFVDEGLPKMAAREIDFRTALELYLKTYPTIHADEAQQTLEEAEAGTTIVINVSDKRGRCTGKLVIGGALFDGSLRGKKKERVAQTSAFYDFIGRKRPLRV